MLNSVFYFLIFLRINKDLRKQVFDLQSKLDDQEKLITSLKDNSNHLASVLESMENDPKRACKLCPGQVFKNLFCKVFDSQE